MKRWISYLFLSHKKNGYAPKLLAEVGAAVFFVVILITFEAAAFQNSFISSHKNLAAIYASSLETLANQDRSTEGLPNLKASPLLEQAAQAKADDMIAKGYFAHYAPDGTSPWYWISKAGYEFSYAGENLAINFSDSDVVNSAWLASPLHRANILNVNYTDIGAATAEGMYQGKETTFVVEMFGTPAGGGSPDGAPVIVPVSNSAPATSTHGTIAVRNIRATVPVARIPSASTSQAAVLGASATGLLPLDHAAASPRSTILVIYGLLSALIVIVFIAIIAAGIRRHNIRQIIYGTLLIILMLVLGIILYQMTGSVTIL